MPSTAGHGSAAPYGLAGSPAASTTAAPEPAAGARSRSTAAVVANWLAPRPSTKYPRRTRPLSSNAASTRYAAANPPGRPSAATDPRVTTPYRSSSSSASSAARSVGAGSASGSTDQRPATAGGALRARALRAAAPDPADPGRAGRP